MSINIEHAFTIIGVSFVFVGVIWFLLVKPILRREEVIYKIEARIRKCELDVGFHKYQLKCAYRDHNELRTEVYILKGINDHVTKAIKVPMERDGD